MSTRNDMSGKVKAFPQAGTPSQEYVDSSLQFLEDTRVSIEQIDVTLLTKEARDKAVQIIKSKTEQIIEKQTQQSQNSILKTATSSSQKYSQMFQLIQPILNVTPTSDTIIKWARNVVKFFAKYYLWYFLPYQKMILLMSFATQYQIAFTQECAKILNALSQKINQLMQLKNLLGQAQSKQLEILKQKIRKAQEEVEKNKGLIRLSQQELQDMRGKLKRQQEIAQTAMKKLDQIE